jgi:hypothetical protein
VKGSGAILSLADDLKAAATDSLKKCATLLGVGLYLYGNLPDTAGKQGEQRQYNHSRQGNHLQEYPGRGNGVTQNDNARISNKQLNYLLDLGKDIGLDSKGLDQRALEEFGVRMSYLNRKDASAFINSLKRMAA